MTRQWIASDLRTGRVLADLPTLDVDWPLRRTLGQYETGTAHLYLDGAPENWQRATLPGAAVLHTYDDADPAKSLQWSGIVTQRVRDTGNSAVDLAVATGESYFDRRYSGDVTYTQQGQNAIVQDLLTRYIVDGTTPGLPITARVVTAGAGALRDATWNDTDNATVYARLQQLMSLNGGPEWTVEWVWTADLEHIVPVLLVGNRIGSPVPAGLGPATTWEMPGCLLNVREVLDYSSQKGANTVTAKGVGQGSVTPTSGPLSVADFQGRPTYEYRWTPSNSETDPLKLIAWAQQAVALLAPGAQTVALQAALDSAPRLGQDWAIGDDIGYSVADDPMFPGGLSGVGRAIAYQLDRDSITPVLAQASVYTEAS